jgi:RNA polymerase sigma-70 factor (ECF subfamily)
MALAGHVREAMEVLSEGEKQAIELAYFGGRTYKEAAAELGEAEGTVKSRIRVGLKRLRAELVQAGVTVGAD